MKAIKNYTTYNQGMAKNLSDKLFFIDKLPYQAQVIDFGCADGTMMETIKTLRPDLTLIGYDIDKTMLELCKDKGLVATDNLSTVEIKENSCLILSSVIHEINSYDENGMDKLEDFIKEFKFSKIFIRDMCLSEILQFKTMETPVVENEEINERLTDFMTRNDIDEVITIADWVHFCLKYSYVDNWEKELNENYVGVTYERFMEFVENIGYNIDEVQHFNIDHIKNNVLRDLDYKIKCNTHIKLCLVRKGNLSY